MKRLVKPACLVLAAIMVFGLFAGCGETKTGEDDHPEFVYTPAYTDIDVKFDYINASCWANGRVYFAAQVQLTGPDQSAASGSAASTDAAVAEAEKAMAAATAVAAPAEEMPIEEYEPVTYGMKLFSMAEDGSDVKELTGYKPPEAGEGMDSNANLSRLTAGADGSIWAMEEIYRSWLDESMPADVEPYSDTYWQYYRSSQDYRLVNLSGETGEELGSVDLSFLKPEGEDSYFYINSMVIDGEGNIYIVGNEGELSVLDSAGTLLFTVATNGGWINGLVTGKDGAVLAIAYDDEGKSVLKKVDLAKKNWTDTGVEPPVNAWNFYPGAGDYDFYYGTDSSFFGFDMATGTGTNLLTWINCDVDYNTVSYVMPLADGRILCISSDASSYGAATELITMTKTPYSASEKTTLTYACMYLDYNIRAQIIAFNKKSDKYRIEVRDYSEYNTNEDYNAGVTKLNTEIIAGNVPDIISVSSLPIRQYAAKGLLEDLWPLIEADTALGGREGLVEPVMKAMEQDGKLYQICSGFYTVTTYAPTALVGGESGWTLEEMNAALAQINPNASVLGATMVKSDWVYNMCSMYMDDLVDWDTGKCHFDEPLFIDLLKVTERMPETFDYENYDWQTDYVEPTEAMARGDQLMDYFYFSSYNDVLWNVANLQDYTFIGFPTADGSSGSAFQTDNGGLAISSRCKDKEGAWQFLRTFLTEEYQTENVWSLPTNKAAYAAQIKKAMTPDYYTDENGEQVESPKGSYTDANGNQIDIYALSQESADKLMALVDSTTRLSSYDQSISDIITGECAAFFAGAKTAEDTAAAIQSKVNLYINEQR